MVRKAGSWDTSRCKVYIWVPQRIGQTPSCMQIAQACMHMCGCCLCAMSLRRQLLDLHRVCPQTLLSQESLEGLYYLLKLLTKALSGRTVHDMNFM